MKNSTSDPLEGIALQLVGRGLPVEYADRAAGELADHHRDLVCEFQATGLDESAAAAEATRRLGDTRTLVKRTVREYQRRFWCGRWPLLTFMFGPLVLLMAAWIGTILVLMVVGYTLEAAGCKHVEDQVISIGERIGTWFVIGWFAFVLPAGVLLQLSRLGARAGLGSGWVLLAAMVLALNVGTMQFRLIGSQPSNKIVNAETRQPLPPDRFVVSTPLWVFFTSVQHASSFFTGNPQQLGQLLLPVIVAGFAVWRNRRWMHRWQRELAGAC
jgi:hypothetical protein